MFTEVSECNQTLGVFQESKRKEYFDTMRSNISPRVVLMFVCLYLPSRSFLHRLTKSLLLRMAFRMLSSDFLHGCHPAHAEPPKLVRLFGFAGLPLVFLRRGPQSGGLVVCIVCSCRHPSSQLLLACLV